ncbi:hypothetical protein MMC08_001384 [Hypocenomyce scalaris]|nr:hypothetical protein [Hypocenomyce scalaris]
MVGLMCCYLVATEYISAKKFKGDVLLFRRGDAPAAPTKKTPDDFEANNTEANGTAREQWWRPVQRITAADHTELNLFISQIVFHLLVVFCSPNLFGDSEKGRDCVLEQRTFCVRGQVAEVELFTLLRLNGCTPTALFMPWYFNAIQGYLGNI